MRWPQFVSSRSADSRHLYLHKKFHNSHSHVTRTKLDFFPAMSNFLSMGFFSITGGELWSCSIFWLVSDNSILTEVRVLSLGGSHIIGPFDQSPHNMMLWLGVRTTPSPHLWLHLICPHSCGGDHWCDLISPHCPHWGQGGDLAWHQQQDKHHWLENTRGCGAHFWTNSIVTCQSLVSPIYCYVVDMMFWMLSGVNPGLKCPNQTPSTFLFTFPVCQAAALVTWGLTWAGDRPVMVTDTSVITPTSQEGADIRVCGLWKIRERHFLWCVLEILFLCSWRIYLFNGSPQKIVTNPGPVYSNMTSWLQWQWYK